jgi:hypothetical protein
VSGLDVMGNFRNRWGVELCDSELFNQFKNRLTNMIELILKSFKKSRDVFLRKMEELERSFSHSLGERASITMHPYPNSNNVISRFETASSVYMLCLYSQAFMRSLKHMEEDESLNAYVIYFNAEAERSSVNAKIIEIENQYLIIPLAAEELDKILVEDVLKWLSDYPRAKNSFIEALKSFTPEDITKCLDELRKAFEFLLMDIFENDNSLEQQYEKIKYMLNTKEIDENIKQIFLQIYSYYKNYQNKKVKHGKSAQYSDIEFIIYQTGSMMRFILELNRQSA